MEHARHLAERLLRSRRLTDCVSRASARHEEGHRRDVDYNGPRNVSVSNVPDPRIERPTYVIVRVTITNIH